MAKESAFFERANLDTCRSNPQPPHGHGQVHRMTPSSPRERASHYAHVAFCAVVIVFLIAPILVVVPLSFNAEPYFTFTEGMLRLDAEAYSLRWYASIVEDEEWLRALVNSLVIGVSATVVATVLGTLAALGLANPAMPGRPLVMGLLISPMVTPVIISAAGFFFFYSSVGLAQTHLGLILAHAALGTPFVVITVTATLAGFDVNLTRAAASLGAGPWVAFRRIPVAAESHRGCSPAPCSRSRPRSMKWWLCCSWAASTSAPFRARCGRASASRSVRPYWPWRPS